LTKWHSAKWTVNASEIESMQSWDFVIAMMRDLAECCFDDNGIERGKTEVGRRLMEKGRLVSESLGL
jgi:hypothetical protein